MPDKPSTLDYTTPQSQSYWNWFFKRLARLAFLLFIGLTLIFSAVFFGGLHFIHLNEVEKVTDTQLVLKNVKRGLDDYRAKFGHYPSTEEGLLELVHPPPDSHRPTHPFLDRRPVDRWGNAIVYRSPGDRGAPYDIYSDGSDGIDGTADDISSPR